MIPKEIVEEVRFRNGIESVIGEYVTLKKAGSRLVGLCPFHSEKSPSFTVFTDTTSYYCFGCGAGGDVVNFIMRAENLSYADAVRYLAKRAGITIPENTDYRSERSTVSRERIYEINREAARYFVSNLARSPEALEYAKKRGLQTATLKHFGIGYAPTDFTGLTRYLSSKGYRYEETEAAFLNKKSEKNGKYFDIFKGRLMFPVIDVTGNVVAFGGRILTDEKPKYINSADTPAFSKRHNLFALNFAKNFCGEQMILCEGYMDVVSLHAAGFQNAVATCGTAITPEQARLMKRYTKSVIISYDADEAGQNAADKAFGLLREAGLEAKLLKVNNAKDPDEYIKKFGPAAFRELLGQSCSEFDFKYSAVTSKYDVETTDGTLKATAEMTDILAKLTSEVERDTYVRMTASRLRVPYEALKHDVDRKRAAFDRSEAKDAKKEVINRTIGYGDRVNPDRIKAVGAEAAEEVMIGILTLYPEMIPDAAGKIGLRPEEFATGLNRKVYEAMLEYGADFTLTSLSEKDFSPDEIGRVTRYSVNRREMTKNGFGELSECAARLRELNGLKNETLEDLIARKRKELADKKSGRK